MFGSFPSCHRCCLAIRMCVSVLLWKLPKNGLIHCNSCINDMGHCASVHDQAVVSFGVASLYAADPHCTAYAIVNDS